jgi:signal peptidase I
MDSLTIPPRDTNNTGPHRDVPAPQPNEHYDAPEQQDSFVVEIFKFAILALIIVVPFRIFIAQPFIVNGASMAPTFETGQYLIVDQVSYRFDEPQRGDVVIFKFPNDPSKFFIKRIVGLPGEVVQLANGVTTIKDPLSDNELILDEQYLVMDKTDDHLTITLSNDEYFVMGDNRSASSDSRVWGPVPRDYIVGRAFVRLMPPGDFGVFPGAYTFTLTDDSGVLLSNPNGSR